MPCLSFRATQGNIFLPKKVVLASSLHKLQKYTHTHAHTYTHIVTYSSSGSLAPWVPDSLTSLRGWNCMPRGAGDDAAAAAGCGPRFGGVLLAESVPIDCRFAAVILGALLLSPEVDTWATSGNWMIGSNRKLQGLLPDSPFVLLPFPRLLLFSRSPSSFRFQSHVWPRTGSCLRASLFGF